LSRVAGSIAAAILSALHSLLGTYLTFVECIESLEAWDPPIIAHWRSQILDFLCFIPPSRQQHEASQPWREEHNGSAWLSILQIQMPASFKLSTNHKYHPNIPKHLFLQVQ